MPPRKPPSGRIKKPTANIAMALSNGGTMGSPVLGEELGGKVQGQHRVDVPVEPFNNVSDGGGRQLAAPADRWCGGDDAHPVAPRSDGPGRSSGASSGPSGRGSADHPAVMQTTLRSTPVPRTMEPDQRDCGGRCGFLQRLRGRLLAGLEGPTEFDDGGRWRPGARQVTCSNFLQTVAEGVFMHGQGLGCGGNPPVVVQIAPYRSQHDAAEVGVGGKRKPGSAGAARP